MGHPALDLDSKTAVVIGGTSRIGLALAMGLALAGADVVPTGRRRSLVQDAVCEIICEIIKDGAQVAGNGLGCRRSGQFGSAAR